VIYPVHETGELHLMAENVVHESPVFVRPGGRIHVALQPVVPHSADPKKPAPFLELVKEERLGSDDWQETARIVYADGKQFTTAWLSRSRLSGSVGHQVRIRAIPLAGPVHIIASTLGVV
jgi:hypothetical protein